MKMIFWPCLTAVMMNWLGLNELAAQSAFVGSYRDEEGMEWRYGIIDNLNLKWNNVLDQPFSITAGRQDIVLGDFWNRWLVADGTPLDGSWSYFLDSARVTCDARDIATKFDLIGIDQKAYADDRLPVIDNQQAALVEQDEQGIILYASNKSLPNTQVDGYFIYKNDDRDGERSGRDGRAS